MHRKSFAGAVLFCLFLSCLILTVTGASAANDRLIAFSRSDRRVSEALSASEWEKILGFKSDIFHLEFLPATPLTIAVHLGCLESVKTLLEKRGENRPALCRQPRYKPGRGNRDTAGRRG